MKSSELADWPKSLRQRAMKFSRGAREVEARWDRWGTVKHDVIMPTLTAASEILKEAGLTTYAKAFSEKGRGLVQFWTTKRRTPVVVETYRPDGSLEEREFVEETEAAMTYEQQFDGRIAHWQFPHRIEGEIDTAKFIGQSDPATLSAALVRGHLVDFLDLCWESSFLGGGGAPEEPIGFRPPADDQS